MSKPQDMQLHKQLAFLFDRQKFMRHLGVEIVDLANGHSEMMLAYKGDWSDQAGAFDSGLVGTLAQNAAYVAAATLMKPEESFSTGEYKINLFAPAVGEKLVAVGTIIKSGRSLKVARSDIYALNGSDRLQCASALVTLVAA